jgi:hypothetical protein
MSEDLYLKCSYCGKYSIHVNNIKTSEEYHEKETLKSISRALWEIHAVLKSIDNSINRLRITS